VPSGVREARVPGPRETGWPPTSSRLRGSPSIPPACGRTLPPGCREPSSLGLRFSRLPGGKVRPQAGGNRGTPRSRDDVGGQPVLAGQDHGLADAGMARGGRPQSPPFECGAAIFTVVIDPPHGIRVAIRRRRASRPSDRRPRRAREGIGRKTSRSAPGARVPLASPAPPTLKLAGRDGAGRRRSDRRTWSERSGFGRPERCPRRSRRPERRKVTCTWSR